MDSDRDDGAGRGPDSILFESAYWRGLLDEIDTLNDALLAIGGALANVTIECLPLILEPSGEAVFDRVRPLVSQGMVEVEVAQAAVLRITELANGRVLALRREAGLAT